MKITYLQDEQQTQEEIIKKAKEALKEFVEKDYVQNPIKAQFKAFQKAKRNISLNDLF